MSHDLKLKWAYRHLEALHQSIERFIEDRPYRVVEEHNRDAGEYRLRVKVERKNPNHLALRIGDVIFNLRSALDHLAYAVVCKAVGTSAHPSRIEFPIFLDPPEFTRRGLLNLTEAPDAHPVFTRLQPCTGRDPAKRKRHPLWILHELNRIDKHRHLLAAGAVGGGAFSFSRGAAAVEIGTRYAHEGAFEDNAEIFSLKYDPSTSDTDVEFDTDVTFDVAFSVQGPAFGNLVSPLLYHIHDHIRDRVIPAFKNHL
ncbi:MAG: hypothetical protein ACT4P7_08425 [Gemmatimonadaceae bacterium]